MIKIYFYKAIHYCTQTETALEVKHGFFQELLKKTRNYTREITTGTSFKTRNTKRKMINRRKNKTQ